MPQNIPIKFRRDTTLNLNTVDPVPNEGEPIFNKETGSFKIGNNILKWSELPDYKDGKFSNIVTVSKTDKFANFCCADETYGGSDAACLQAAIDFCATNNISTVEIHDGAYSINTTVVKNGVSITIRGVGNVVLNSTLTANDAPVLQFSGINVINGAALTADAATAATSVTLADVTGVQAGHLILISNNVDWSPSPARVGFKIGEMYEIKAVDTANKIVTLNEPLLRGYTTAASSIASVFNPIEVHIENISFVGQGADGDTRAVYLTKAKNSSIINCKSKNHGLGGMYIYTCYSVDISHNNIDNCEQDGMGYGVAISNACAKIRVTENKIHSCRHCVCVSSTMAPGLNRDIIVSNNNFYGILENGSTIDSHPECINMIVTGNTFQGTDVAFNDGTQHSIFSNNEIFGYGGVLIREAKNVPLIKIIEGNIIHNGALFLDTNEDDYSYLSICNNYCYGGSSNIYFKNASKSAKAVSIVNNRLIGATSYGMRLDFNSFTELAQITIAENQVSNCGLSGIRLALNTTYGHLISIEGNQILNPNLNNSTSAAIYCENVRHANVINNIIKDTTGFAAGVGLNLNTGCDYNLISHNQVDGSGIAYNIAGSNNSLDHNIGYVTENTGTATIPTSGASIVVSHGLATTPTNVIVTPRGNVGSVWADTFTTTQFTIHCSTAPASDTVVGWSSVV